MRMENFVLFIASLLLFWTNSVCIEEVTYGPKQYCQMDKFNASCPRADQVLVMQSALYGRMGKSRCTDGFGVTGCSKDMLWYLDSRCSGRNQCTIPIPDEVLHKHNPCPKDYTTYLEASYSCRQVTTSSRRQCHSDGYVSTESNSGILANTMVTDTLGTRSCPWRIKGLPGQHINLTLFNFARSVDGEEALHYMSHGPRICYKVAELRDGTDTNSINACIGEERKKFIFHSKSHTLDISFLTGKEEAFLLAYQVYGCPNLSTQKNAWVRRDGDRVIITCNHSEDKYYLTCQDNVWTGEMGNCSAAAKTWTLGNFFEDGNFPYGILIVVSIGVALGVFFGGLLLTCVHAYMKRRQRHMESSIPTSDPLYMERRGFPKYIEDEKHYSSPSMKPYPELSEVSSPRDRHMPPPCSSGGAYVDRYMQEENVKNETDLHQSHPAVKHIYESPQFL